MATSKKKGGGKEKGAKGTQFTPVRQSFPQQIPSKKGERGWGEFLHRKEEGKGDLRFPTTLSPREPRLGEEGEKKKKKTRMDQGGKREGEGGGTLF